MRSRFRCLYPLCGNLHSWRFTRLVVTVSLIAPSARRVLSHLLRACCSVANPLRLAGLRLTRRPTGVIRWMARLEIPDVRSDPPNSALGTGTPHLRALVACWKLHRWDHTSSNWPSLKLAAVASTSANCVRLLLVSVKLTERTFACSEIRISVASSAPSY